MKTILKNSWGHLKTILKHKYWVFYYACKLGIPWRGFWHDMSKFSPVEFCESVKFYQGGKASPIPIAKKMQGYSRAWQHHKWRNPHHFQYWIDDEGPIDMPRKYKLEMLADYLGAGKVYMKDTFNYVTERNWWLSQNSNMHPRTKAFVSVAMSTLAVYGEEGFKMIRDDNMVIKNIVNDERI